MATGAGNAPGALRQRRRRPRAQRRGRRQPRRLRRSSSPSGRGEQDRPHARSSTGGAGDERDPGPDRTGRPRTSLTIDSSILAGGGAGIRAFTRNNEAEALVGRAPATSTLDPAPHHRRGVDERHRPRLEQRAHACSASAGNITATVTRLDRAQQPGRELPRDARHPAARRQHRHAQRRRARLRVGRPGHALRSTPRGQLPPAARRHAGDRPGQLDAGRVGDRHRRRGPLGGADRPRRRRVQQRRRRPRRSSSRRPTRARRSP